MAPAQDAEVNTVVDKNFAGDLKVLYTNADGLVNKRYDLKILLQSLTEKPDIIAVTEIKPKKGQSSTTI